MTSPPLPGALLGNVGTPVPATQTASGNTATTDRNDAFAGLLQSDASSTVETSPTTETTLPEVVDADADSDVGMEEGPDAPWPPPGLETLIAGTPAPVTHAATAAGTVTPAAAGPQQLTATLQQQPALAGAVNPALNGVSNPTAATANMTLVNDSALPIPQALATTPLDTSGLELQARSLATTDDASGSVFAQMMQSGISISTPVSSASSSSAPLTPGSVDIQDTHADQAISESIEWMLDQKLQSARIRISPDQLGTIDVEIRLEGDRVHAHFASAHAEVRQVLSDSLPRLRELLDTHGLQMGQTAVESQASNQQQDGQGNRPGTASDGAAKEQDTDPATVRILRRGLLDTYA